ncbi:hypothetical protein B5G54_13730 [Ralstonia solanacearum]|nr:hypothetical protein CCY86_18965 [Ralstonia solanacearum]OPK47594.1 hypothetical protein B5G54_13730 [Ralstonia solanacearum]OYQ02430.1 hypothetical protein B7R79_19975 [Ralstonia solanacearum]PNQ35919.1 winged helix-turn-helix domain-containing protein [Ralstonia solanacearum]PNQ38537.1 winged helix-turn-helix domain-containing protein [Ralstonia solanacearum]
MIDMPILSIIRRWHLRDQIPLREIARRLDISRNTVRRYLRADVTTCISPAADPASPLLPAMKRSPLASLDAMRSDSPKAKTQPEPGLFRFPVTRACGSRPQHLYTPFNSDLAPAKRIPC